MFSAYKFVYTHITTIRYIAQLSILLPVFTFQNITYDFFMTTNSYLASTGTVQIQTA